MSGPTSRTAALPHAASVTMAIVGRELRRAWRNPGRVATGAAFPLVFLAVFGSGLTGVIGPMLRTPSAAPVTYEQYVFPGVIGMAIFFGAMFNAISLVHDREFGVLKNVLVAPVPRSALALGKALGSAVVATAQGTLVLLVAPLIGIQPDAGIIIQLLMIMFLGAFTISALGVALAARVRSTETFQVIDQFVAFPLIFLSTLFFPLRGLPAWMEVVARINPLSYAVDALRRLTIAATDVPVTVLGRLSDHGMALSIAGRQTTIVHDVAVVSAFAVAATVAATALLRVRDRGR